MRALRSIPTSALSRKPRTCCCLECASRAPRTTGSGPCCTRASCASISRARPRRKHWPISNITRVDSMAAEAGGDLRAGIGSRLRAAREKKSLTILQAAEKMHVDARILESLEAEDFVALGAPVYARGHLRHYAELVGESPTELQQLYADSTRAAPAQPDLTRIARGEPESDSSKLVGPAAIGLVAVGLVGVVWWLLTLSTENVQPTTVHSKVDSNTTATSQANPVAANTDADNETPVPLPAPVPESTPRGTKSGVGPGAKGGSSAPGTQNTKTAAATQAGGKS